MLNKFRKKNSIRGKEKRLLHTDPLLLPATEGDVDRSRALRLRRRVLDVRQT
jgi:hypothetical protein